MPCPYEFSGVISSPGNGVRSGVTRGRSTFSDRPVICPHPGRFYLGDHKDRTLRCGMYVRAIHELPLRNHDISSNPPYHTTRTSTAAVSSACVITIIHGPGPSRVLLPRSLSLLLTAGIFSLYPTKGTKQEIIPNNAISTSYYIEKKITARVSDLSVDELRVLIQEVVRQTLKDVFRDLDDGLKLREDFRGELQASLNRSQADGNLLSAESVASQLGLEW